MDFNQTLTYMVSTLEGRLLLADIIVRAMGIAGGWPLSKNDTTVIRYLSDNVMDWAVIADWEVEKEKTKENWVSVPRGVFLACRRALGKKLELTSDQRVWAQLLVNCYLTDDLVPSHILMFGQWLEAYCEK